MIENKTCFSYKCVFFFFTTMETLTPPCKDIHFKEIFKVTSTISLQKQGILDEKMAYLYNIHMV